MFEGNDTGGTGGTSVRRHAAPRRSSFSAWVKRDAELFAALEASRELGTSASVNRAKRCWQEHFRTMPSPVGRRGGRGARR